MATFSGASIFAHSTFHGAADFRSATFKSTTRFDDACFLTAVPEFHATGLYDDTTFTLPENYRDNWPPIKGSVTPEGETKPREVMSAERQKSAYNRLRLFMNRSLQVESEQFFHRMEMRCKAVTDSWHHRPLYWLFAGLSDYGNSVGRPLLGLFVLWLIGVPARLEWTAGNIWADAGTTLPAMGWSFANLFPFFGFRRLYFDVETLTAGQAFIGGLQTTLGFVLLFLLGLGLRNRFRLR